MKRLGPLARPLFAIMLVFTIFACSGGGCSGCEGCGIYPIPGGFPIAERIPNSAQVRLTESGITFIEDNIDPIVRNFVSDGLDFQVNTIRQTFSGITFTICSDDDCGIHIEIADLELLPQEGTNVLRAHIRVRLDSIGWASRAHEAWDGTCDLEIETRNGSRDYVGMVADIYFENITQPARAGYTQIRFDGDSLTFAEGEDIENDDIDISGGFLGSCGLLNLGFIKSFILDQLTGQLNGLVGGALGDQLCTRRGALGCPTGTHDRGETAEDAVCYYEPAGGSDECVPTLLGLDGRGDLGGQFLGGFSPGAHAPIQLVLASGGDGEAVNNGMSLFMVGGFMSMDREFATSPGHNPCVPLREEPPLPDVARAAAFRGNVIPGTSTPSHIGVGIAEDYMNYAGYGMYDSGMLCIGAGTRLSQQLSTGLVSAAVASLRDLAFPATSAPLTMAIRPQNPPHFEVGTDPTLAISLDDLMIDFYVWSTERYVRFMTYQTDMTVNIDLSVEGGEIVPRIASIDATNSMVFNNEMILEQPDRVAATLETIIGSFAGMLAGSISPIALPDIMGFELDVGPDGVRGVTDSGEDFLGIFANLRLAAPMPLTAPADTTLEVSDLTLDRDSMTLEHWNEGDGNSAWLDLRASSAAAGVEHEYSYRIDHMTWSPWTTDSRIRIDDDVLLLQARHVIEARARVRGEAGTVDPTPARADLIVDIDAPTVQLSRAADGAYVATASDLVSGDGLIEHRFRIQRPDGEAGEWSAWQSSPRYVPETLTLDGGTIEVEARDEAGNVGTSSMPLIRGIPNPAGGGCDCGVMEGNPDRNGPLALVGSLLLLGAMLLRRRDRVRVDARTIRGIAVVTIVLAAILGIGGCECGSPMDTGCGGGCVTPVPPASTMGSMCCEETQLCIDYDVDRLCASMPGYTCPIENVELDATCEISCSMCERKPPLDPGLLATDLDLIVTSDGDTFVSGYSPGVPPATRYGDLVFGQVQGGDDVEWEVVDGAPDRPVVADPEGWRGGVEAAGDDVGRWTSMAEGGGSIYIAYYDATNGALKIAVGGPGAWNVSIVDDTGDSGRYPSIALVGGSPVISYLRIEVDATDATLLRSSVRVATASSGAPTGPTDWTIAEVGSAPVLCRPQLCASAGAAGETCLETGACVTPSSDCPAACADGEACFAGACTASLVDNYVEDIPPAYGLHTSLAVTPTGLGLVWYDRSTGNLYGAEQTGGTWAAPFLIDGYLRADPNVGDSGLAASLFVDTAGTWHVTYVDGAEETLRYAQIAGGAVTLREIVDDGASADGTTRHDDGRHVVGDDSSVVVTAGGEVRVVYQDDTDRTLMLARRASGATTWTVSVIDDVDNTGFWAEQVLVGSTSHVATWWRRQHRTMGANGVRVTQVD